MKGQALISLLFFVLIIITVITATVIISVLNIRSASMLQEGVIAYYVAESGAENALLRVLRDPTYTGEANLPIGDGYASTQVTPGNPTTIISTGKINNFMRKIRVVANYTSGYYTVSSWQEIN